MSYYSARHYSIFDNIVQHFSVLNTVKILRFRGNTTLNHIVEWKPIWLPQAYLTKGDLVRICIRANYLSLVRDLPSSNMLEAAILVSALQARHVRARFECPGTLPSHYIYIYIYIIYIYIYIYT